MPEEKSEGTSNQGSQKKMVFTFDQIDEAMDRYLEIKEEVNLIPTEDDSASKISSSRLDYEGAIQPLLKQEDTEVGYFHLLNCDIKASEDLIRQRYLIKT